MTKGRKEGGGREEGRRKEGGRERERGREGERNGGRRRDKENGMNNIAIITASLCLWSRPYFRTLSSLIIIIT